MPAAPPTRTEPAIDIATRASLARLVAHFLLHEIDEPGLGILRQPEMLEAFEKLEPGCRAYLTRDWQAADFEQAAVDYCSLFVLPGGAPPFAGAWLGGAPDEHGSRLLGRISQVAQRLEVDARYANLPADHLGLLLTLQAEAWQQEDPQTAELLEDEVLRPTAGAFGSAARERTGNRFYRAMASLLVQLFPRS